MTLFSKMKNKFNILDSSSPSIVTIGTFDGVHIGHQKIIKKLVKTAKEKDLQSVVLTFFPHPKMVVQKDSGIKLLNTIDERKETLHALGLDTLYIQEFTKEFSELSAQEFVKTLLVDTLNAKHIIIGYDHQFGKNRSGTIDDLKHFGKHYGFEVEEIPVQDIEDVAVSSTKIRNALLNGDIITANSYLGHPYLLTGTVVKGKELGRTINFPTANIAIEESYKLIPKQGAYVVKTTIDNLPHRQAGTTVFGMMNIGTNPTVNGTKQTIEVHLLDFNTDIYGTTLKVEILQRLRDEQRFESIEALKEQLKKDESNTRNFIKLHNDQIPF